MGRIVNELDSIQFSIKKASQLVKEIGRQVDSFSLRLCTIYFPSNLCRKTKVSLPRYQVATDKCIMLLLLLIVCGVIAIIVVKVLSSFYPLIP